MMLEQVKKILYPLVLGLLIGGGVIYHFSKRSAPPPADPSSRVVKNGKPTPGTRKPTKKTRPTVVRSKTIEKSSVVDADELPKELQATATALQDALDRDDEKGIVEQARVLLASGNQAARAQAAEALGFSGWEGFADIVGLLMDADEEVREMARQAWKLQLDQMDSKSGKIKMLEAVATNVIDQDPEYFEDVIFDASMEMPDNEMLTFIIPLYSQTEKEESRRVILETIDGITMPDNESKTLEEAEAEVIRWRNENAEEIAEEEAEKAAENAAGT